MVDFGQLEDRLNRDPAFRRQFLNDPVGVLRTQGLVLSFAQASALRDAVVRMKAAPGGVDALNSKAFGLTAHIIEK